MCEGRQHAASDKLRWLRSRHGAQGVVRAALASALGCSPASLGVGADGKAACRLLSGGTLASLGRRKKTQAEDTQT